MFCRRRAASDRALATLLEKVNQIMSQLDDITAALQMERDDTAALVGITGQLLAAVQRLVTQVGQVPADVQAVLDSVQATLAGTHTDTTAVETQLSDLVASLPAEPTV